MKNLLLFVILFLLFLSGCFYESPAPTDDELIKNLQNNREAFDQLVALMTKDNYFVVQL